MSREDLDAEIRAFIKESTEALMRLDLEWCRNHARLEAAAAGRPMPSDEVLLISMHKARYEATEISDDLRHASGHWLRERGFGRRSGGLLPPGELPR